jgi:hypothetical protein
MKKIIYTQLLAFIIPIQLFAASGGPDLFGYTWKDSNEPGGPVYNWIDIASYPEVSQVFGLSDDNNAGPYPVGFNFQFYWYQVSQFWAGSNGYIAFNNAQISSPFPVIPSSALPNNFIAAMATDLNFDGATNQAACYFWKNAASDTLIISYENVPFWNPSAANGFVSGLNSFQMILSNVDSSITFQYKVQNGTSAGTANFLSIGIENNSGNIGLQHSYGQYPPVNYAVKYYYPANSTYQVSDAAVLWNNNDETGAKFLISNGAPFDLTAKIKNVGNQPLSTFNVQSNVLNSVGTTMVTGTTQATVTAPGNEMLIAQTSPFNPVTPGTYSFNTEILLANDATPSNNSKTMELVVLDTTTASISLQYCDNTSEGLGLSWQGGNGGVGVYFEPPFTPFVIQRLEYFIVSDPQAVGFTAKVNANNGINNTPGNELVNISVPSSAIVPNNWNQVVLNSPLTVSDSGVYVSWLMNGDGISLGQDQTLPLSNRTFEVLGNGWAVNRYREIEDIMIKMVISTPTGAVTSLQANNTSAGNQIYPMPFNEQLSIKLNNQVNRIIVSNAMGQEITSVFNEARTQISFETAAWPSGMYVVQLIGNNGITTQKIIKK